MDELCDDVILLVQLQKKLSDAQGSITTRRYAYDGQNLLFELDEQNNVITEFVHGSDIDEPLALKRGGQTYSYHADALGSIMTLTDQTNKLVQRYEYDAYGNRIFVLDPAFKQPYSYTGREWDEESGLYYYRARYYDPGVGRFIQKDPIGLAGGMNLYSYVGGNPVKYIDPLGLWTAQAGLTINFQLGPINFQVSGGSHGAGAGASVTITNTTVAPMGHLW